MKNGTPTKILANVFKQNLEDDYMDMCVFIDSPNFISHDNININKRILYR